MFQDRREIKPTHFNPRDGASPDVLAEIEAREREHDAVLNEKRRIADIKQQVAAAYPDRNSPVKIKMTKWSGIVACDFETAVAAIVRGDAELVQTRIS